MRRYLATFFRFWIIALLPVVLLPLAVYTVGHTSQTTFTASSNIFIAQVLDTSSGYSAQPLTPAQSESSFISQWLQSPSFALRVAENSPLFRRYLQPTDSLGAAAAADLEKNVLIAPAGDNLLSIAYTGTDSARALQVVSALLQAVHDNAAALHAAQITMGIQYYAEQLTSAQQREKQSADLLSAYMRSRGLDAASLQSQLSADVTLDNLYEQNRADQAAVTAARQRLSQASGASATLGMDAGSFTVVDAPRISAVSSGHGKQFLIQVLGALLIGLLLGSAFIVTLTAMDPTLRSADEAAELLGLPALAVIAYDPLLARQGKLETPVADRSSLSGGSVRRSG